MGHQVTTPILYHRKLGKQKSSRKIVYSWDQQIPLHVFLLRQLPLHSMDGHASVHDCTNQLSSYPRLAHLACLPTPHIYTTTLPQTSAAALSADEALVPSHAYSTRSNLQRSPQLMCDPLAQRLLQVTHVIHGHTKFVVDPNCGGATTTSSSSSKQQPRDQQQQQTQQTPDHSFVSDSYSLMQGCLSAPISMTFLPVQAAPAA